MYVVRGVLWLARGVFWKWAEPWAPRCRIQLSLYMVALTQGARSAYMQSFVAQRVENRMAMKTTALLIGRHGRLGVERAITENVSSRGVRVISASEWYTDDTILSVAAGGAFYFGGAGDVLRPDGAGAVCDGAGIRGQRAVAGDGDEP